MFNKFSRVVSLAIFVACAMLAGCATAPPVGVTAPFNAADYQKYVGAGTSTIVGQGFLRQNGGGVVTCAGSQVLIAPATPYTRESTALTKAGRNVSHGPGVLAVLQPLKRFTQCDAQGNFSFKGIPAGDWLVGTEVSWVVNGNRQGGLLRKEVSVSSGMTTQVLMTNAD